jgi:hypothetical protein
MTRFNIPLQRLRNQRLAPPDCESPAEVVSWLGAVQAQDYYGAKWAVGQRLRDATDDHVEQAFAAGEILRTHVLRPTWHFVVPADIRWLLQLTGARVIAASSYYHRKLELDAAVFKRSTKSLIKALRGGKQLTRQELRSALDRDGVVTNDLRLIHLLARAEVDGVICSGGRRGKQFTYALLDERVPASKAFSPPEPLAELAKRYFLSRGPATFQDFVWWSGLTVADARKGLEMVQRKLVKETIDGKEYWFPDSNSVKGASPGAHLLPAFDEFLIAYKDRSAVIPTNSRGRDNFIFNSTVVVDGRFVGTWKRTLKENSVSIQLSSPARTEKQSLALKRAVKRYGAFLGVEAKIS